MQVGNLNARAAADSRRIRFALLGMLWAWISGVTTVIQGNINAIISDNIEVSMIKTTIVFMVISYSLLALNDILAGLMMLVKNMVQGRGIREYARTAKTKVGLHMLLASFFGGAGATGLVMTAYNLAGLTYTAILISTSPIITAILGRIFFKESISRRVYFGIAIAVAGICLAGFSPPTGDVYPFFIVGIILAGIAPVLFTFEGMLSTYASDLLDPNVGCGLYRGICSGVMIFIAGTIISLAGGFGFLTIDIIKYILTTPLLVVMLLFMALASVFSYLGTYVAFNMTGPTRCLAVVNTLPVWSIPVGLAFAATGLYEYNVTKFAVLGAFIIVIGILLVIAKPRELVNLRDY